MTVLFRLYDSSSVWFLSAVFCELVVYVGPVVLGPIVSVVLGTYEVDMVVVGGGFIQGAIMPGL